MNNRMGHVFARPRVVNKMEGQYVGEPKVYVRPGADHSHIGGHITRWATLDGKPPVAPPPSPKQPRSKRATQDAQEAALDEKFLAVVAIRPTTSKELCALMGRTYSAVNNRMKRLAKAGKCTRQIIPVSTGGQVSLWSKT